MIGNSDDKNPADRLKNLYVKPWEMLLERIRTLRTDVDRRSGIRWELRKAQSLQRQVRMLEKDYQRDLRRHRGVPEGDFQKVLGMLVARLGEAGKELDSLIHSYKQRLKGRA